MAPISSGSVIRSANYLKFGVAPYSTAAQAYGLRVMFRQPWSTIISSSSSDVGCLGGTSLSSASAVQYVTPTLVAGSAAPGFLVPFINIPKSFARYRFRKLNFEYVTHAPTTTSGSVVLAYMPDGDAGSYTTATVAALRELNQSVEFPAWVTAPVILGACNDARTDDADADMYYCDAGSTTIDSNNRIAYQGYFFGSTTVVGASGDLGMLYAEGVLDLYVNSNQATIGEQHARPAHVHLGLPESKDSSTDKCARVAPVELKKKDLSMNLDEDYQSVSSTPRVPSDERKSEREASVERKPVVSGGPRSGLFR